jgi:RimJ/RimL family protein N-acetyltransferase
MDAQSLPVIKTPRLVLRWISEDDVDAILEIFSDPQVVRYLSHTSLADREAAAAMQREIAENNRKGLVWKWGIALADTVADSVAGSWAVGGKLIGTATLFNLSLSNGRAELGYAMGRAYWGQGYMHEALTALVKHAFEAAELRRLEADVDPRNPASIRTLERLGFQREGYLRERWHVAGEIQDAFFYGLLKREWQAR